MSSLLPEPALLAVQIALALAAAPDNTGGDDATARALDAVQVTASRHDQNVSRAPRAVTVVQPGDPGVPTGALFADYLRGAPGVFVQQTTPGQGNIIVRGLKGSEVLHLVDGARMNTAIFRNAPNNYISLLDPFAVERVEVVRGPASVLYGSDAMGGVVHVRTALPEPGDGERWRLQSRWASADLSFGTRLSGQLAGEDTAASIGLLHQELGERRTGRGGRQPFSGYRARGADLRVVHDAPASGRIELHAGTYEQPSTPRHDALVPGFGQDQPENAVFAFEPNRRDHALLRWRLPVSTALFDEATVLLHGQRIVDGRRARDTGAVETVRERNTSELLGASVVLSRGLAGGGLLSFGFDGYMDEVASSRSESLPGGAAVAVAPRFPDGARMRAAGLFAHGEWPLGEGHEFTAGARLSAVSIELPATPALPAVDIEPEDFSGGIGYRHRLDDRWQLVANLGRGFRAPNVFDLGNLGPRPGGRFNQPNTGLGPETVLTADVGLRFASADTMAEAFLWASDYDDRIASVVTGEVTAEGEAIVQNRNIASARFHGLEFGLRHVLGAGDEVYASLNWTWGENRSEGGAEPADRVPPLNGRIGWLRDLGGDWTLDLHAWAAGSQDRLSPSDVGDPRIDPQGTPGFAAFGASVHREFGEGRRLSLELSNLLDRRYREHGSGLDAEGLGAAVSVDWSF